MKSAFSTNSKKLTTLAYAACKTRVVSLLIQYIRSAWHGCIAVQTSCQATPQERSLPLGAVANGSCVTRGCDVLAVCVTEVSIDRLLAWDAMYVEQRCIPPTNYVISLWRSQSQTCMPSVVELQVNARRKAFAFSSYIGKTFQQQMQKVSATSEMLQQVERKCCDSCRDYDDCCILCYDTHKILLC